MKVWKKIPRVVLLLALFSLIAGFGIAAIEENGSQSVYSALEKAFYLSADDAVWIQPGLHVTITGVTIPADRRPVVTFRLTDDAGQGLDKDGKLTPGTISPGIILAYIPQGQSQYVDYTTRVQTSPITKQSATQAAADTGGVYTSRGDGTYDYQFRTVLPADYDTSATHTLGIYASRNLSDFGLSRYVDDQIFNFVPNGSPVTTVREVALTASCNQCHDPLSAHGETGRQNVEICILCHTPQTVDPDTGNTVDMKVMVHKIHAGEELPSVKAGTPYQIIGFNQSVADYSTVAFPQDLRNCRTCHNAPPGSKTQPAQMNNWFLSPTKETCGSCHDNINWASGENHVGGPAASDKFCASCHYPQGEFEYDASIINAHIPPYKSAQLRNPKIQILNVVNTAPGLKPTITFKITDKSGAAIDPTKMPRLTFNLAGPNSDYRTYTRETANATSAFNPADGTAIYNFTNAVPENATGSWSIEAEGYLTATLNPGPGGGSVSQRDAMDNVVVAIPVTDKVAKPRVMAVDTAKCNKCHEKLQLHGGNRNKAEACVVCHNPTGATTSPAPGESYDFKWMIHKIHTGEELSSDYSIGNTNFTEVRYPGDRSDCLQCHVDNGFVVPVPAGRTEVKTPGNWWTPTYPTAAACLSCHDSIEAAAHAIINTATFGESCAVCHKETADFAVKKVHAR
jgi:OmcA/MtrC family decaheme c-type cytochrome